jgi:hypothetical protein
MSTQISAFISDETRRQIEAYVKRSGVTKARLVEDALLHHLQALREIPDDVVVPARLVLADTSFDAVVAAIHADTAPVPALRALMVEDD